MVGLRVEKGFGGILVCFTGPSDVAFAISLPLFSSNAKLGLS